MWEGGRGRSDAAARGKPGATGAGETVRPRDLRGLGPPTPRRQTSSLRSRDRLPVAIRPQLVPLSHQPQERKTTESELYLHRSILVVGRTSLPSTDPVQSLCVRTADQAGERDGAPRPRAGPRVGQRGLLREASQTSSEGAETLLPSTGQAPLSACCPPPATANSYQKTLEAFPFLKTVCLLFALPVTCHVSLPLKINANKTFFFFFF